MSSTPTLKKALSQRQLRMIAIGGVIGGGLFVGSGVVIASTGPGAFLTYANESNETFTSAMKLANMRGRKEKIESPAAERGRAVFVENCAICHSSKQPDGFELSFSRDWSTQHVPTTGEPAHFVLPMDFADWEAFKLSDAYREYVKRIRQLRA